MIRRENVNKTSIYSDNNTPVKNLKIDSSLLTYRREKPVNSSIQKIST